MKLENKYTIAKVGVVVLLVACMGLGVYLIKGKDSPLRLDEKDVSYSHNNLNSFSKSFTKEFTKGQDQTFAMLDKYFDNGFFKDTEHPFQQMAKIRKEIMSQMDNRLQGTFDKSWDNWYDAKFSNNESFSMKMDENPNAYVYHIAVPEPDRQNINVNVSKDGIKVEGELNKVVEKKDTDGQLVAKQKMETSVSQLFSLPANADYGKAKITNGHDEIVINVPKIG